MLRSQIGDAQLAMARGNLPEVITILDSVIARAEAIGLESILSRALHTRAHVAGSCGQPELAVQYLYRALNNTSDARERDRILSDMATGFRYLGLFDSARDTYLVLAATAQEQWLRYLSELNLMELMARSGLEVSFTQLRRKFDTMDLDPMLRVTYALHAGRGSVLLGNRETGIQYLERAVSEAEQHGLNQLLFEAESALADAKQQSDGATMADPKVLDTNVREVVGALQMMKAAAGIE
jgi:tetratricopeptide (TPR) repeat protein